MIVHREESEKLLTWLDVERTLKQSTALWSHLPPGVKTIDCFASGVEIQYFENQTLIEQWLIDVFGSYYIVEKKSVRLSIGDTLYPVDLVLTDAEASTPQLQSYPLWRDVTYLPSKEQDIATNLVDRGTSNELGKSPLPWNDGPDLVSFHSFKGGVGRTTALMTYVAACMQDASPGTKRILVIDADLEAPGVSFWLDEANMPTVSFVKFLEALHYPPAGVDKTLDFFAQELRKTSLNVGGVQRELFVLPAALSLSEIQDMPVSPEHLARNPSNPWNLSDQLHALGKLLDVDAVFIDLRAGLSELASPIIFDPRIDHFFVSTVAPQSVKGMAEIIRRLYAFNHQIHTPQPLEARPTIVLSLLTKELREGTHYVRALNVLGEAYPSDEPLNSGVQWLEADFLSSLMSIGSVREALEVLPQNRLYVHANEWAKSLYADSNYEICFDSIVDGSEIERKSKVRKLQEVCNSEEFADSGFGKTILAIEPLINLGKHYSNELPNILMIGAKGAGKTFTFRKLVQSGGWANFLVQLGFDEKHIRDADIFPVLWSDNIEDRPDGEIKRAQINTLFNVGSPAKFLLSGSNLRRKIEAALKSNNINWEDFWDHLILEQFSLKPTSLSDLNSFIGMVDKRVIFVFDGIEDAFIDVQKPIVAEAINALLRLPNRISELPNRRIGTIIFVRSDYVQMAIRQNLGQWLQRFQPFRLQWNPESFLRLAFMLSCRAGINLSDPKSAESLRIDDLKIALEQLWGKKLGSERSKEAHSSRWVYAALSDLKGNVQARDLVRFLGFAAKIEVSRVGQTWPDRILSPESMRRAIPDCSIDKVKEAKSEIAPLKKWIEQMELFGIKNLKVPFSQDAACLNPELLSSLQELGVIYEDIDGNLGDERLFVPEIYRFGLGFETSATGRPRTQALLKKNIGVIPL